MQEKIKDDTISRRTLIEHLRRTIEASSNNGDYNEGFNDGMDFAASFASTLPSSQPEQRWIPCSELLPDKEGRYLCTVGASFHNPRVMTYAPDTFLKGDCDTWRAEDGAYCFNWFVEAWVPLPEPYKGDNNE